MLKRVLKWIAICAAGLIGLFLIVCTLIVWCLTPPRLTPIVERQANRFLDADVSIGRVELTFWHTFPKMTVDVDSLCIVSRSLEALPDSVKATLPADADSLLSIGSFHGGINVMPLLAGRIALYDVLFDAPRVNLLQVTPEVANYLIVPSGEPSDTTSSPMVMPRISINRFAITDAAPLRYRSLSDSVDVSVGLRELSLNGREAPSYRIMVDGNMHMPLLGEFDLTSLAFGADGRVDWDMSRPLEVSVSDFTVSLDSIAAKFSTAVNLSDPMVMESLSVETSEIPVVYVAGHLPAGMRALAAPLQTDMKVSVTASLSKPWCVADTVMPCFEASLSVPQCSLKYENWNIREFSAEVSTVFDGAEMDSTVFTLKQLKARGEGLRVDLRARATNVVTDPKVEGTFNGDVNLTGLPRTLRARIPGSVRGRISGNADFRFNASDLSRDRFHRMYAKGRLCLHDFDASLDSVGVAYVHDATFDFGSSTSFIKDSAKVDSLLTLSLKVDTLSASGLGLAVQLKGLRAGAGTLNRASSSDTTEINPFGAHMAFERFVFDSPADTLRLRMRDASVSASLRRFNGNARIPQLKLSLGIGALQFGQALTKLAMRQADVEVSVNMRPAIRRNAATVARADSLRHAMPDSLRARPSVSSAPVAPQLLDSADRNLLRRWDFNGHIHAQSGRLVTPAFPIRNTITHIDLHFNQDSIKLENLSYKAGQSDFLLNGTVSNLRRALVSRRGATLGVELTVSSDTLNINEIVRTLFAGGALSEQADSASVWGDDDHESELLVEAADTVTTSGPVLLPRNIDARFAMRADHVLYSDMELRDFKGDLLLYDGALTLRDLSAQAEVGRLDLSGMYNAPDPEDLKFGMGLKVSDFRLDKLTSIVPAIDSLMPIMQNFAGIVNADVAVSTDLTPQMDIDLPTLKAAIKVDGDSLVLLDPDTFKMLSKWLFFKEKKKNYIDHMEVEVVVENSNLELYPFMFDIDRYRLGIMGHNDLAMNLNYHISVLKSPIPFKFGINITGTPEKMKIRTGGAKFKENMIGERQEIADNTRINIVEQINSAFRKGISNARSGRLNFTPSKSSGSVPSSVNPQTLLDDFHNQSLTVADSLRLIRQGLIANPDTVRFPVRPVQQAD